MNQEDLECAFVEAGWEVDGGFAGYLKVGEKDHLSILAYQRVWESDELVFELCDGEKEVICWAGTIPTPSEAAAILVEHGHTWDVEWDDLTLSTSWAYGGPTARP